MNKRIKNAGRIVLLTVLLLTVAVCSGLTAYADGLTAEYRTREEIRDYIAAHPADDKQTDYALIPSATTPYSAGRMSDGALIDALNSFNQIRYIAGLEEAKLDSVYNEGMQSLTVIMAANGVPSYTPAKPAGMGDALYETGTSLVLGANLAKGYRVMREAVLQGWMPDGDDANIVRCAHRRRMLNPELLKVGFGQVSDYSAMYVKDTSAEDLTATVAWPAQNTPASFFSANYPWTLTVGVTVDSATVKVVSEQSGKQWSFSGNADVNANGSDGYFNITNSAHGQPGCVIFRPTGITCAANDSYIVTVACAIAGSIEEYSYRVRFFDQNVADNPAATDEPYAPVVTDDRIDRVSGKSRILTAIAISAAGWDTADTAVIANGYSFPDALAGVPLAAAADAPILLTAGKTLEPELKEELSSLGVKKVYLLGGEAAVSNDVLNALVTSGLTVRRLAGDTRYETAVEIARELEVYSETFTTVYFANAENFPDALAISPVAAIEGNPILYISPTGSLDQNTAAFVDDASCWNAVILGGDKSVSAVGESSISGLGLTVARVAGSTRYDTALRICQRYDSLFTGSYTAIATGVSFPDALAGGALAARMRVPMVLIGGSASSALRDYVIARQGETGRLLVFGGVNSVSPAALASLK